MSCQPIDTSDGLRRFRELMNKEKGSSAMWDHHYGPKALLSTPDPQAMINLGAFSKRANVPLPVAAQLEALKMERQRFNVQIEGYEKTVYPMKSDAPVSERAPICSVPDRPRISLGRGLPSLLIRSAIMTPTRRPQPPAAAVAIKYYGDAAFHSKPRTPGAPATYQPWEPRPCKWTKRKWDVDHIQHIREGLGPAHVAAREYAGD